MAVQTAFRSDERFTQKTFREWLEKLPSADINHYELIDGRIVMTPPAGWGHGSVDATLTQILREHVSQNHLGQVLGSSAGYDLPSGDTLEPDVSYVSAKRFAAKRPTRLDQFLRAVPNLAVEILSPSTAKRDRMEKKAIYAANGIDEYWIVDPKARTITVFHLAKGAYDAGKVYSNGFLRSRVLPRLRLRVEKVFASLDA